MKFTMRWLALTATVMIYSGIQVSAESPDPDKTITCRDSWVDSIPFDEFKVYSCSKCFVQVFWDEKDLKIMFPPTYPYYLYANMSDPDAPVFRPDALEENSKVCARSLSEHECRKWRDCCQAAQYCCAVTQQAGKLVQGNDTCAPTWDGISCWKATPAGHREQQACPSYYLYDHVAWSKPIGSRQCEEDASWQLNNISGYEYSEYQPCFDDSNNLKILRISLYIDFTGNGISIIFLITSIIIILTFRDLRVELQQRTGLKIHFNLFVSVLCTATFTVSFHSIYHDAFTSLEPVYQNNAIWCRALHIMTKYFKSTTYMCMFCEGLFLYRRISQVMQIGVSEALLKYIFISWALPLLTIGVYVIVRVATGHNEKCWIDDNGLSNLEYIHMIPNLFSLVCNLVFLVSIQYMLCTKMRSDTSDRRVEVLRHAIRATMSLIPIFGLQFLFLIYRPKHWPPYEIIVAIFESTQGTLVAILYCFTTREMKQLNVKTVLASHLQSCRRRRRRRRNASLPANPSHVKKARLTTASHHRLGFICTRVQRLVTKRPNSMTTGSRHSLPDVVDCGVYLEPTMPRRDSSVSKTTQRSFVDGSGSSINSQPIYKFDCSQKDKGSRVPKKNGICPSIQLEYLDVRTNENGTHLVRHSPVRFQLGDADMSPTTPLMETHLGEMNGEAFAMEKLSPNPCILSPILEQESQSNSSNS